MKKIMALILIAVLIAAAADGTVRGKREPGSSYTGLSSDTKPTTSTFPSLAPGELYYEMDPGNTRVMNVYRYNGTAWVLEKGTAASSVFTRTAVGDFPGFNCAGATEGMFVFQTSGADTTTVRPWIYFPLMGWIVASETDTLDLRFAGDTMPGIKTFSLAGADSMRLQVVSEQGGIDSVKVQYSVFIPGK